MCGIFGLVGQIQPRDRQLAFKLLTELAIETQSRGRHATGYAGMYANGQIFHEKAPIQAEKYVETFEWQRLLRINLPEFFIGHCRHATNGDPKINSNNHPFLSPDGRYAFIHNGVVNQHKLIANSEKLSLETECDSEVILRVIEKKPDVIEAIKNVFKIVFSTWHREGACALLDSREKAIFLFRDNLRPCHVTRLPRFGNAVAFASTELILNTAIRKVFGPQAILQKGFDLKPMRIYRISYSNGSEKPKISTKDIPVRSYSTRNFFSRSLTVGNSIPSGDPQQRTLFDLDGEIPDTGPQFCECPCGYGEWVWEGEGRTCMECYEYRLSPGLDPEKISDEEEYNNWVKITCQECGQTWRQRHSLGNKCFRCGSKYVLMVSLPFENEREKEHPERISAPNSEEDENQTSKFLKKCHDCGMQIPKSGPSRCTVCANKRRDRRRKKREEQKRKKEENE